MGANFTGGLLTGGWEYVEAAYGLTALALSGYLTSVIFRLRAQARERRVAHAAAAEAAAGDKLPNGETAGAFS
jgi:uncharacterized membrane protein